MSGWDDPTLSRGAALAPEPPTPAAVAQLADLLGRGGQAVVLSGPDRRLPRDVAWKSVPADDPHAASLLRHEAAVLAHLEHPGIVPIYDIVEAPDGGLRLALKRVRGRTFRELLAETTVGPARVALLRPLLSATEAIAYAHSRGVVHRDINGANVMVGAFGEIQVIDWGLALTSESEPTPGAVVGTPRVMSPEQARGEAVDARADVWALGALLLEIVSGAPVFPDLDADATVRALRLARLPDLNERLRDAPPELAAIITRALAADPAARYVDAKALADDLDAYLTGRVVAAYRYRPIDLLGRFVRSFRLPLAIAAATLVTSALALSLAYLRVTDERDAALAARDTANAALAEAGLADARRELEADARPEAELAAAQVLARVESPAARGVIAAFAHTPRPARRGVVTPRLPSGAAATCVHADLSPDGRTFVCASRDRVDLFAAPAFVHLATWRGPSRDVRALDGGRAAASLPGRDLLVLDRDGSATRTGSCGGRLSAADDAVADAHHSCLTIARAGRTTRTMPCGDAPLQAAVPTATGFFALCPDGTLVHRRGDDTTAVATALASEIGVYGALVPTGPGRLAVGTADGGLLIVSTETGAVASRSSSGVGRRVDRLAYDPVADVILAHVEAAGVVVVQASGLAPVIRLPRRERTAWLTSGGLTSLADVDRRTVLSRWYAPTAPVHVLYGRPGVTSVTFADDGAIGVTHTATAELIDARTGASRASEAWFGRQGAVAKAMVVDGAGAVVALTSAAPPPDGRTSGFTAIGSYRRLAPLPSGDGPLRYVRASSGALLELVDGDAVQVVATRRHRDIATVGAYLAAIDDAAGIVRLWDVHGPPVELASCAAGDALAVALLDDRGDVPDLVLAHPSGVSVIEPDGCRVRLELDAEGEPTQLAASAAGGWIAAGTRSGELRLWDLDGRLRASLVAHDTPVRALAFDAGGDTLLTGAWDGRVRLLDLASVRTPRDLVAAAIAVDWQPWPGNP